MALCKSCEQPLVLELDPDDFNEATSSAAGGSSGIIPDDLELTCGCHYHWQCLLDESSSLAVDLTCPSCKEPLITNATDRSATNVAFSNQGQDVRIFTRYNNEGGVQNDLDILPLIIEEAYLAANPSFRPARAFLTMCAEGDVSGIMELVQTLLPITSDSDEEHDEEVIPVSCLLRYQDALDGMKTGLHLAVEKEQQEVLWLLLWLVSELDAGKFPDEVVGATSRLGAGREIGGEGPDVRSLRDERGRTAGDVARAKGGAWTTLVQGGIL